MIRLFTGTPGSGKSYHALREGLWYQTRRREVVANFPIKGKAPRWHWLDKPTVADLLAISKTLPPGEGRALLVVDEAQRLWNARDWATAPDRSQWLNFFSQHRKLGFDVILVSQQDRMLDRQIRGNVEEEVKHLKANRFFLLKLLPVPIFLTVTYWYQQRFRGKLSSIVLLPWVANRYDHMRLFEAPPPPPTLVQYGHEAGGSVLGPPPAPAPVRPAPPRPYRAIRGGRP